MRGLYDASAPVVTPFNLVQSVTGRGPSELALSDRAVITFAPGDLNRLIDRYGASRVDAWSSFRQIYRFENSPVIGTCCPIGGPNIAALLEELACFGVREFVLCGYCGALTEPPHLGDVLIAEGALREEGVSHHYLSEEGGIVTSDWYAEWADRAHNAGFRQSTVWSCDAIYRETINKVNEYVRAGLSAVEMETASFYAVCRYLGVKGIAFLVVSDQLGPDGWTAGFRTGELKVGARKLADFVAEFVINRYE